MQGLLSTIDAQINVQLGLDEEVKQLDEEVKQLVIAAETEINSLLCKFNKLAKKHRTYL